MRILVLITFALGAILYGEAARKSYEGYQVVSLRLNSEDDFEHLRLLEDEGQIKFWQEPIRGQPIYLLLAPGQDVALKSLFSNIANSSEVEIPNVQRLIDQEAASIEQGRLEGRAPNDNYERYATIVSWLQSLANTYSSIASVINIGTSYLGQQIIGLKLTIGAGTKPRIVLDACIHSREWLACATANYIIERLLRESNGASQALLQKYEWYIIPVLNPDGYEYCFNGDRMWRKTLSVNPSSNCLGADPNRNFDNHFAQAGASTNPCAETYAGLFPFSESETNSIAQLINQVRPRIYFSIHAFSQFWLLPWGWTNSLPPTYNELARVANIGNNALFNVNGRVYQVGSIANVIYLASGSSVDYAYDNSNVPYANAYEVYPSSPAQGGFIVDRSQIEPSGREIYASLVAYVNAVP